MRVEHVIFTTIIMIALICLFAIHNNYCHGDELERPLLGEYYRQQQRQQRDHRIRQNTYDIQRLERELYDDQYFEEWEDYYKEKKGD